MDTIKEKIRSWKLLADLFLRKNIKVFIREFNGNIYFGKIILNSEDSITIDIFGPEQRANTREKIYWYQISDFDKYKEKEETQK